MPVATACVRRFDRPAAERLAAALDGTPRDATLAAHVLLELVGGLGASPARGPLAARGLTVATAEEGRRLVHAVHAAAPASPPDDLPPMEIAERELWAWYLEWSAIARASIREPRLLRALGFSPEKEETAARDDDS